jgi:hypothetical protein
MQFTEKKNGAKKNIISIACKEETMDSVLDDVKLSCKKPLPPEMMAVLADQ